MFITFYYRLRSEGEYTAPLQADFDIPEDMCDVFANARGVRKADYDRIAAEPDDDVRRRQLARLNYEIAASLFPEWCSKHEQALQGGFFEGGADVCVDGCEVSEGNADAKDAVVLMAYRLAFDTDDESDWLPFTARMPRNDCLMFKCDDDSRSVYSAPLQFDDIAELLPEWCDRVYDDIVEFETNKFRREPFYEIWGFTKDEVDAADWNISEIADISISVYSMGCDETAVM